MTCGDPRGRSFEKRRERKKEGPLPCPLDYHRGGKKYRERKSSFSSKFQGMHWGKDVRVHPGAAV